MESKIFYYVIFMCAWSKDFVLSAQKYGQISDCYFYDKHRVTGVDNVTFICAKISNVNGVFIDQARFHCSNYQPNVYNYYPGTIDFRSCNFSKLERNYFKQFPRMHTFIISNLELETLDVKIFSEAKNVTNLIASQNHLKEIPPLLLTNAKKLKLADFSNNSIEQIDSLGFMGASSLEILDLSQNSLSTLDRKVFIDLTSLKSLNLSYNQINELDPQTFSTINLLSLDLSHNELLSLEKHIFNELINLKRLNLSDNSIGGLDVGLFSFMPNLEYLNLRRTNLSNIKFGTLSHQSNLISLDLSDNFIQKLDFNIFIPIMHDLQTLELDGNELINLDGFKNTLFPQLRILDIKNNDFNCSYLMQFMESVNWEKIRLPIDPIAIKTGEKSIRGIKCNSIAAPDNLAMESSSSENNGSSSTFVKFSIIFMCIVMMTLLVLFMVLNKDRLYDYYKQSAWPRQLNGRLSTATLNIDYNEA